MSVILIGYDLRKPGQDYTPLFDEIKSLGEWWHCLDSTWMVKTTLTVEQIRNRLLKTIDQNDQLLVITAAAPAAWFLINPICSKWLTEKL
jgi:hypothetical protein